MNQASAHDKRARLIAGLAGGWVADAASLGLHWIYDSNRILDVGGQSPEFMPPRADYFTGIFGYFAHEGKRSGDLSHYGAATGVLLDSLMANEGSLDIRDYQRRFRAFFGPGGHWRGFIDNPTRITLDNLASIEKEAIEKALSSLSVELTDRQERILVQKVLPYTRRLSGDQLASPVRQAIGLTYQDKEIQDAGVYLAETIDQHLTPRSGADDLQLPAVSKLAPLVASYLGQGNLMEMAEAAVRVTTHNDEAVAWALCTTRLLEHLFQGDSLETALDAAIKIAPDRDSLEKARSVSSLDGPGAGDAHGRTCYLHEAMPVIFHILTHATNFTEAIRANIQCGGDSCGRAWVIGPAMAAAHGIGGEHGIPPSWLARVTEGAEIFADIEMLVDRSLTGTKKPKQR